MTNKTLNSNFNMLKKMKEVKVAKRITQRLTVCKTCGANESKFVNDNESGDTICKNCGAVQSERRANHQNARQANGQILYARVFVEEDQKVKLLVNNFFNLLFGDLAPETQPGIHIASIYKEIKKHRAKYITKSNIQSAFKGLHMPTVVVCILYCTLIEEKRALPLSIIVSVMNKTLSRSRTNTSPVSLKNVGTYRTHQKYGISSFFKLNKKKITKCYNYELQPSDFTSLACKTLLRIQDKNIQNMIDTLGNELIKEYNDRTSPALIATAVLYFVGSKLREIDFHIFGLKKKELTDVVKRMESSKNVEIIRLLALI